MLEGAEVRGTRQSLREKELGWSCSCLYRCVVALQVGPVAGAWRGLSGGPGMLGPPLGPEAVWNKKAQGNNVQLWSQWPRDRD